MSEPEHHADGPPTEFQFLAAEPELCEIDRLQAPHIPEIAAKADVLRKHPDQTAAEIYADAVVRIRVVQADRRLFDFGVDEADAADRVRPHRSKGNADQDVRHDADQVVVGACAAFAEEIRRVGELPFEADDAADHEPYADAVAQLLRRAGRHTVACARVAAEV